MSRSACDEQVGHDPVAVPLAVAGHDVPRGRVGAAARERVLVGRLVVVPERALLQVAGVVLPVLRRVLEPLGRGAAFCSSLEMCSMTLIRWVPGVDHPPLELVDPVVAGRPLALGHEVVHADDEHVLVLRPVEHDDLARAAASRLSMRQRKSWASSSDVGFLNEVMRTPAGFIATHDLAHRAVLAGGVHPLQQQQHRPVTAAHALGVEPFLEPGQLGQRARRWPPRSRRACPVPSRRRRRRCPRGRSPGPEGDGLASPAADRADLALPTARLLRPGCRMEISGILLGDLRRSHHRGSGAARRAEQPTHSAASSRCSSASSRPRSARPSATRRGGTSG